VREFVLRLGKVGGWVGDGWVIFASEYVREFVLHLGGRVGGWVSGWVIFTSDTSVCVSVCVSLRCVLVGG